MGIFEDEEKQQYATTDEAYNQCSENFSDGRLLVDGFIGATQLMQAQPAQHIQQCTCIKAWWQRKGIII